MLLIDAANVVGSRPDGWWKDRPGAAGRLVEQVRAAGLDALVVLEGAARARAKGAHVVGPRWLLDQL